ncbi:MAG: hypothetical protein ACOCPY_01990 [Halorubrum sp.]
MTANATRHPDDRSGRPDGEGSFRRAVPMAGTGDGPRPDPTAFASAARTDGERRADRREATTNHTAADDTTQ